MGTRTVFLSVFTVGLAKSYFQCPKQKSEFGMTSSGPKKTGLNKQKSQLLGSLLFTACRYVNSGLYSGPQKNLVITRVAP